MKKITLGLIGLISSGVMCIAQDYSSFEVQSGCQKLKIEQNTDCPSEVMRIIGNLQSSGVMVSSKDGENCMSYCNIEKEKLVNANINNTKDSFPKIDDNYTVDNYQTVYNQFKSSPNIPAAMHLSGAWGYLLGKQIHTSTSRTYTSMNPNERGILKERFIKPNCSDISLAMSQKLLEKGKIDMTQYNGFIMKTFNQCSDKFLEAMK